MINAGVLGSPIAHSLSPLIHRTAYQLLGIAGKYDAYEVASGQLQNFLSGEGRNLNCLSLTMPLKEEALTIAEHVSDISRQIASGNTLVKKSDGWHLTSTDVEGVNFALLSSGINEVSKVLVIGAGATSRAVVAACSGADISIIGRSVSRMSSLHAAAPKSDFSFIEWESEVNFDSFDLVVNTTPGNSAEIYANKVVNPRGTFFEVIYNPWPTKLLSSWRLAGGNSIDGLELLVHQAISQIQLFSGIEIDRAALAKELRTKALSTMG